MDKIIKRPLISVIMPAYNASDYIMEAINSVIGQTYNNWELIIVNDGSTDSTAEIIKGYLSIDNRIYYYYQENGKQGKARNLAISKSKGEYLAFLDADDLWVNNKLEIQVEQIQLKNVDLVFSNAFVINDSEKTDLNKVIHCYQGFLDSNEGLDRMIERNRIPILTVLVKRSKVIEVGMFSEKINMHEDSHLWLKLLINKAVLYGSNETLAIYRIHKNSSTANEKFALDVYINVLSEVSYNNKEINYRILNFLIRKQIDELEKLNNEIKHLKNNFFIKIQSKIKYLFFQVR
ncbi:glycosyltransferase family 2 protein [Flavobacterium gawalongense]|uniref:Glycosyltransferase n=1 Tax=Flavobacterium gawalongense TaxID=2594432 RepID=A0ABY3CQI1_9FLAO|nr:glycosyltransferase [Flavobacterium gawalongense]TRX04542.1 glycosyltransferase [Flavobacterium gawalongense]TRX10429.1 glycosyltransferase [Flavobacterium gawalongense]